MGLRKKKSILDQAGDAVSGYVEHVRPQLESAVATARQKAGPVLAEARDKAAPMVHDAREKAGPAIAAGAAVAAEKIAAGASIAAEKAAVAADKVAEAAEPKRKPGRVRKLLMLTGLAAAIVFVASRLRPKDDDAWQSSYTPTPAPRAEDDSAGASPDEAIADQAEAPRSATTPDDPAKVVDIEDVEDIDDRK